MEEEEDQETEEFVLSSPGPPHRLIGRQVAPPPQLCHHHRTEVTEVRNSLPSPASVRNTVHVLSILHHIWYLWGAPHLHPSSHSSRCSVHCDENSSKILIFLRQSQWPETGELLRSEWVRGGRAPTHSSPPKVWLRSPQSTQFWVSFGFSGRQWAHNNHLCHYQPPATTNIIRERNIWQWF